LAFQYRFLPHHRRAAAIGTEINQPSENFGSILQHLQIQSGLHGLGGAGPSPAGRRRRCWCRRNHSTPRFNQQFQTHMGSFSSKITLFSGQEALLASARTLHHNSYPIPLNRYTSICMYGSNHYQRDLKILESVILHVLLTKIQSCFHCADVCRLDRKQYALMYLHALRIVVEVVPQCGVTAAGCVATSQLAYLPA